MQTKPLEGVKVADFGWVFTVPLITKTLGDLGAEVIKIEGTTRGDGERRRHPYKDHEPGLNRAADFNYNNTSKLSVSIDLTHPKGIELAKRLAAWSDIVVENFSAGAMEKMGLGYEELRKIRPDIIMLSASMQGQTGPHSRHPGYGHHLTALAGFHHLVGWPDRPSQHFGPYTDWVAPQFGLVALLSALDYRRRTGKGQYFDMSQYEVGEHFLAPLLLDYAVNGRIAKRVGNRDANAAPHGTYRCRGEDRWCAIAVFTDEEWRCFCKVIGNPPWTDEARFASLDERKRNEDELDRLVESWTVDYPPEEVMNLMQAAGVPAGLVETEEDIMEHDPQFRHANFFRTLHHAEVGEYRSPRPPFVMSKAACDVRCAPLLGEHNEYVFKEILAMDDEEISELVMEGVIE